MRRKYIFPFLFLGITFNLFSQSKTLEYGLKGGLNFTNFTPNSAVKEYYTYNSKTGFHIGAFLQYALSEKFSIKPEILLTTLFSEAEVNQTNIDIQNPFDPTIIGGFKFDIKEYLISIPILINFKADAHFDIETGFPVSYVIASTATPNEEIFISYYNEDKFEIAWNLGVGYLIAKKYRVALAITAGLTERNNTRSKAGHLGMEYFF